MSQGLIPMTVALLTAVNQIVVIFRSGSVNHSATLMNVDVVLDLGGLYQLKGHVAKRVRQRLSKMRLFVKQIKAIQCVR